MGELFFFLYLWEGSGAAVSWNPPGGVLFCFVFVHSLTMCRYSRPIQVPSEYNRAPGELFCFVSASKKCSQKKTKIPR